MNIHTFFLDFKKSNSACFALLIDPDKIAFEAIPEFMDKCLAGGVDAIFVGGSIIINGQFDLKIKQIKAYAKSVPVIIFPGSLNQISKYADAILYLSLISGRNPEYLIGSQVSAAPIIKMLGIEAIATAYMLIESGETTSVEFMSGTKPIPRNKVDIAIAHALAAQYLGFKLVYLEAGSGAEKSVPKEMILGVSKSVDLPIIVGGGIKMPDEAREKVASGADIIVVGNHFEGNNNNRIKEFASAIHQG